MSTYQVSSDGSQARVQVGVPATEPEPQAGPHVRVRVAEHERISVDSSGRVIRFDQYSTTPSAIEPGADPLSTGRRGPMGVPVAPSDLQPTDTLVIDGVTDTVAGWTHAGVIQKGSDGLYSLVGSTPTQQPAQVQDEKPADANVRLDAQTEAELDQVVERVGTVLPLAIVNTLSKGGDPRTLVESLAQQLGREPEDVSGRIAELHARYVRLAEQTCGMDSETYARFCDDVSARQPEEFQAALSAFAGGDDNRPLKALAAEWAKSASTYSEDELYQHGLASGLPEGSVYRDHNGRAVIRHPSVNDGRAISIRQAIREGYVQVV